MIEYKIERIAVDTREINYRGGSFFNKKPDNVDYLLTSVAANNDFLLPELFEGSYQKKLITILEGDKEIKYLLERHLAALGRQTIDILLVSASCIDSPDIKELMEAGLVKDLGVLGSDDIKKLDLEGKVKFVALPLCPLNYNHELIELAKEKRLSIIGLNPFGEELSVARNIKAFTVPYLLKFAATNADIVVVPGKDLIQAKEQSNFLESLIGLESSGMYVLKKSTSSRVKELKKFTYSSIQVDQDTLVPFDSPEEIVPDTVIAFGGYKKAITTSPDGPLSDLDFTGMTDGEAFALVRNKAIDYVRAEYPGYELSFAKIGCSVFTIKAVLKGRIPSVLHRWIGSDDEVNIFLVAGTKEDGYSLKEQNIDPEAEKTL